MILALLGLLGGYSMVEIAKWIVIAIVLIGIVLVVCRVAGIVIPDWIWKIAGLVALAIIAVIAIRFVAGL